ncbi:hypothetical protein BH11MYX1_BH11MYX1_37840 [soil metagenome]
MEPLEPRHLPAGTVLDDTYRIDELLAVGGRGAVYIATHITLRERVAIKVLTGLVSSQMTERFHREAIMASAIGHEGIAQVNEIGTTGNGEPFVVMELLEGESLGRRMKLAGALSIEVACELACSILSPLGAAHRAGILHRDLKPENVFLVRQSRGELVKLLDFGIACTEGLGGEIQVTGTGFALGTSCYLAPEQTRGDAPLMPQTDLYALGVMLYEMLVGAVPITGETDDPLVRHATSGTFVPPRQLRPELPVELEAVILQAMSAQPTRRPRSAEGFAQQLLPFCRQIVRAHAIDRIVGPDFAPALRPTSGTRPTPLAYSAQPRGPGSDATALAPMTPSSPAPRAPSKRGLVIRLVGLFVVAAGLAAVVVSRLDPPPVTPPPVTPPPRPAAPTPVVVARRTEVTPTPRTTTTTTPTPRLKQRVAVAVHEPANGEAVDVDRMMILRFEITPQHTNAVITIDGKAGGLEQAFPQDGNEHAVHITAAGYKPYDVGLHFTMDQTQRVTLEPLAPVDGPRVDGTTKQ